MRTEAAVQDLGRTRDTACARDQWEISGWRKRPIRRWVPHSPSSPLDSTQSRVGLSKSQWQNGFSDGNMSSNSFRASRPVTDSLVTSPSSAFVINSIIITVLDRHRKQSRISRGHTPDISILNNSISTLCTGITSGRMTRQIGCCATGIFRYLCKHIVNGQLNV